MAKSEGTFPITAPQAGQIAELLNANNELARRYTTERVLKEADDYLIRTDTVGAVVACVQIKRVQWYQCELLHLVVARPHRRHGVAQGLLADAEARARSLGAGVIQCTVRVGNTGSKALFESAGYKETATFQNPDTGNNVWVLQKVISTHG